MVKHTQLVGTVLAAELMVPIRFEYLLSDWERPGLTESSLACQREDIRGIFSMPTTGSIGGAADA